MLHQEEYFNPTDSLIFSKMLKLQRINVVCKSHQLAASKIKTPAVAMSTAAARRRHVLIDEMVRVDHAGEVAAVSIYQGQLWALRGEKDRTLVKVWIAGPRVDSCIYYRLVFMNLVQAMQENEEEHLRTMDHLIVSRRARPSAILPVASALGFALGAATALLGKEAAMACTVAVETAIGNHYNAQIRVLLERSYHDEKELLSVFQRHR